MTNLETALMNFVEAEEADSLLALLLERTESERKELEPFVRRRAKDIFVRAEEMFQAAMGRRITQPLTPELQTLPVHEINAFANLWCPRLHAQGRVLTLAIFATGRWSDIKALKDESAVLIDQGDRIFKLLQKFQPPWLQEFVQHLLSRRTLSPQAWTLADDLIRTKTVPPSESPTYALGMVITAREHRKDQERGALAFLRRRPHLLETQVWRLFELEANGPDSNIN